MAERLGMRPRVTSTRRSFREQVALWEKRQRVLRGDLPASSQPFPVASPGTSSHELGLAIDVVVRSPGDQRILGDVWQAWGGRWTPRDAIHYEAGPDMMIRNPRQPTVGRKAERPSVGGGVGPKGPPVCV